MAVLAVHSASVLVGPVPYCPIGRLKCMFVQRGGLQVLDVPQKCSSRSSHVQGEFEALSKQKQTPEQQAQQLKADAEAAQAAVRCHPPAGLVLTFLK